MATDVRSNSTSAPPGLFRAFWRWHFYAAFLVVPIFAMLSLTGLIYLFRFQVEPVIHADVMRIEAPPTSAKSMPPLDPQLDLVQRAYPDDKVGLVREGREPNDSNVFSMERPDGSTRDVFVNPWEMKVLGSLDPDRTLSGYAVRLHGDLMAGRWGDGLIEIAACWAIVMALSGYYLYWAGRSARLKRRAKEVSGAALRHWHATVGLLTGVGLLFMVFTGLPWTGFWGDKTQELATMNGTSFWSTDPGAASKPGSTLDESLPHSHAVEVPWAQGATTVPSSGRQDGSFADIDTAVAVGERQGLRHPFSIVPPDSRTGVYSVMGDAFHDPSRERTVHVDQYSGEVRDDYGFSDYPLLAKTVSQGIGLHEGRSLGLFSFAASALFCLAVLALCITGPLMWWRRRPAKAGSVGAPRGRLPIRATWWLGSAVVLLGLLLPLFGVTLVLVLLLDQLVLRRVPQLKTAFDSVD
ncbi:MAG TPA: PepSY domain-containing protein [Aeromicrobium sp.]|nr:PepSY domain-containing protein [Aeromicrobium sp.]HKY58185.1 PepSY domain-containing protein [Aeromicrobium sp.]